MVTKPDRYGGSRRVTGSVVVFVVLVCLAGYTLLDSADLMSNACFGESGQLPACPARGPDWVRPLPGGAAVLGVLAGLGGVVAGRPVRTPALAAGFLVTIAGLIVSRLMG